MTPPEGVESWCYDEAPQELRDLFDPGGKWIVVLPAGYSIPHPVGAGGINEIRWCPHPTKSGFKVFIGRA